MATMLVANTRDILKSNTHKNIAVPTRRIKSIHLLLILRKKAAIITHNNSLSVIIILTYSTEKSIETYKAYLKK